MMRRVAHCRENFLPAPHPHRLRRRLHAIGPVLIGACHLGSLSLLLTGLSLGAALWALGLYLARMLATTAIYHRLLTHRSYRTPVAVLWAGCLVAASAGQMGPSWWKAHHLAHHRHGDTVADPHTPLEPVRGWRGFWRSQAGWLLGSAFHPDNLPSDVEADPVLRTIDRLHFLPLLALAALSWHWGGLAWLGAFCLSTTLLFHGVATVNSVAHLVGEQPFATGDASRNNGWVALITLGEGWHNLHHAYPRSVLQGFTLERGRVRRLPDPTYIFVRLLQALGMASELRLPSDRALQARASA
jgi:stearoyl-CoA desaturase (delta-9 desaturase)